jgi:adenine-specific DNA-methyltransferase
MMDEIFGGGNFVTSIHWKRSESQNNNSKILSIVGEFILTYIKDKNNKVFNKADLKETALKEYRYEDEKGKFRRGTIVDNSRGKNLLTIKSPNGITKTINSIRTKDFFEEKQEEGLIYWTSTGTPYLKLYLDNSEGQISSNWFDDAGVNEDSSEELTKIGVDFQFSKPYSLINKLIKISSSTDALVLDSFSGSGTTAHSVLNLNKQDGGNRKFILIEMEDYANTITAERVKRVMQGYGSGDKAVAGLGGSFDFYELGKPMFKDDKNLNEEIGEDKIREYIYYTETKQYLTRERKEETKYLLDTFNNTAYYFYYEKESLTTLDHSTLNIITELTEQYLVYADICHLDKKYMQEHNIIFKKIPRDIRRF